MTVYSAASIQPLKVDKEKFVRANCNNSKLYVVLIYLVAPNTPVNITAFATGSRTANVLWQEGIPPNPVNPAILAFEVYLNGSMIISTMATTIVLNFLTPFVDYEVTVAARNTIGISIMSDPVLFMTEEEGM